MKRVERVYCGLLEKIIQDRINTTTQKQLSKDCKVSIGTVNYALKPLSQMGIIEKRQRSLTLINPKKLLLYWASIRNLTNEIIYTTYSKETIRTRESMMPPCIFTAYTGYKFKFNEAPADYGEIYAYGDVELIKQRFPTNKSPIENIFTLRSDPHIEKRSTAGIAPLSLLYVDLWNMDTWYANEFIKALETKLRF
jgi:DNA-binding transcriptional regulator YhcF (GntR family)